ncbi:MAG: hypothetical protein M1537_03035 [Nitrospirae bacterium]|nr:hypothetical protein [Nitrospirota bacterium]MCL5286074.1 hypothetical protein [Nitrospirota bacterium]
MKPVRVRLEPLNPGAVIVSDVLAPSGRLLVRAPATLDETLKDLLRNHGVREVFIEDRRKGPDEAANGEVSTLETRLSLLAKAGNARVRDLKALLAETIGQSPPEKP